MPTIEVAGNEPYTTASGVEIGPGQLAHIPQEDFDSITEDDVGNYGVRKVGTMGLREDLADVPGHRLSEQQAQRTANDPNHPEEGSRGSDGSGI
jgi:hypothetical protein